MVKAKKPSKVEILKPTLRPKCSYCESGNIYLRNIYQLVGIEVVCKRCGMVEERPEFLKKKEYVATTKRPRLVRK